MSNIYMYKRKHENKGLENKLQRSLYESSPGGGGGGVKDINLKES